MTLEATQPKHCPTCQCCEQVRKRSESTLNALLCDLNARYDKEAKWRKAWNTLANSPIRRIKYRLQTQQEYIEHRAQLANLRIGKLMREYDALRT